MLTKIKRARQLSCSEIFKTIVDYSSFCCARPRMMVIK
jgi:hypothetical protein